MLCYRRLVFKYLPRRREHGSCLPLTQILWRRQKLLLKIFWQKKKFQNLNLEVKNIKSPPPHHWFSLEIKEEIFFCVNTGFKRRLEFRLRFPIVDVWCLQIFKIDEDIKHWIVLLLLKVKSGPIS